MCVNTQTPLVQFSPSWSSQPEPAGGPPAAVDISSLVEDVDYRFTPGGVTRMVFPLLKHMIAARTLEGVGWVSLNPGGPKKATMSGIEFHNILMDKERLAGYGKTKETIWGTVHGMVSESSSSDIFWRDDFADYAYYNRLTAEVIRNLDAERDFDVFYVHDFQQLPIGHMLGTLKPKVFRWHIPFDQTTIPKLWEEPLSTYLNSYDVIIASSRRYLDSLKEFGYGGVARHVYPYVDPADYSRPTPTEVRALSTRLGIHSGDRVALVVARMDPIKGQDRVIRAMALAKSKSPELRLLLVGNGSFSSSEGGLKLSKGAAWRAQLEEMARKLEVDDRVCFAGHLSQRELDAAYRLCAFNVLPSVQEGFGLVVIEGWIHRRASLVSTGAGVSELVQEGSNGLLFEPDDVESLAEHMCRLAADDALCRTMGAKGFVDSKRCYVEEGVKQESRVIMGLV
jgi:glycosyltransferase involved in cell wall biosynthesis